MLPGLWPEQAILYVAWFGIGIGFVFVEVAAKTLMQRLGSDETMGRVVELARIRLAWRRWRWARSARSS